MTEEWIRVIDPPSKKYEWSIEDLDTFKNAPAGKKFQSEKFVMYGAKWSLSCCPNGGDNEEKGGVSLFLRCHDFGPFFKECAVEYDLTIEELHVKQSFSHHFTKIGGFGVRSFCATQLLKDLDTITIQCTIDLSDAAVIQLQQLPKLQAKLENAAEYIILPVQAINVSTDDKIKAQRTEVCQKDGDLYVTHFNLIQDWNSDTDALSKFQTVCSFENDDDDSKQEMPDQSIFDQYFEAQSIIKRQKERIDQVTTDEHLLQLDSGKEYEKQCLNHNTRLEELESEYKALNRKRTTMQENIKSLVKKCNDLISEENELIAARGSLLITKRVDENGKSKTSASSEKCMLIINAYNQFMEINTKLIDDINAKFDDFWETLEKQWIKWDARDIIMWFRYKTVDMDTNNMHWETTKKQLEKRNITGKSLRKFSDLTFEFLEIHDFEVVQHLLLSIDRLKGRGDSMKVPGATGTVPEEFICPITKKVMTDPVIAFDGHCYERDAIEQYLRDHNKSPVTGKDAQYTIVFPNHRLRTAIQSYLKAHGSIMIGALPNDTNEGVRNTAFC